MGGKAEKYNFLKRFVIRTEIANWAVKSSSQVNSWLIDKLVSGDLAILVVVGMEKEVAENGGVEEKYLFHAPNMGD